MAFSRSQFLLIDPITPTNYQLIGIADSTSSKYLGGILLADETVLALPFGSGASYSPLKIDYNTYISTTLVPSFSAGAYRSGVLLPDGRIMCVPFLATRYAIYDPILQTLTPFGPTISATDTFGSGIVLPDGRVCLIAYEASQSVIISASNNNYGDLFSLDMCLSAYLNHS